MDEWLWSVSSLGHLSSWEKAAAFYEEPGRWNKVGKDQISYAYLVADEKFNRS